MRILTNILLFTLIAKSTLASDKVFILEQNRTSGKKSTMRFEAKPAIAKDTEVWVSESKIICKFTAEYYPKLPKKPAKAFLDCRLPGGYRVQSSYSCESNKGQENAGYLYVGTPMKPRDHKNFYVYCEDKEKK